MAATASLSSHPAVKFGQWLKTRRQSAGFVARIFAGQIGLSPAEYAELEHGVIHWMSDKQRSSAVAALGLDDKEAATLDKMLQAAKAAAALGFGDIFTREELEPARLRGKGNKQITADDKAKLLDAVFTPLA